VVWIAVGVVVVLAHTRLVSFDWIDWREEVQIGSLSPEGLSVSGVMADCIRWVRPEGASRIDLV
jgi:hypothetical protein